MNRVTLTYVLQAGSAILMAFTLVVGYLASVHGHHSTVILNCVLFWINFGLFYWQYRLRKSYK